MLDKLFTSKECELIDELCYNYLDCTLKTALEGNNHDYIVGDKVPSISLDYINGMMEFWTPEGERLDTFFLDFAVRK
jgi:hypothetical protein